MPKFAAHLPLTFAKHSFLDRTGAAARAGFKGGEYRFPYEHNPQALAGTPRASDLQQVLHELRVRSRASVEYFERLHCSPHSRNGASGNPGVLQSEALAIH